MFSRESHVDLFPRLIAVSAGRELEPSRETLTYADEEHYRSFAVLPFDGVACDMDVQIVVFPETKVAAVEHRGPPELEYETARKLVAWRQRNGLDRNRHRSYGVHYTDPYTTPPADHRVDFCLSVDFDVAPNPEGVINKAIPGGRCALARHLGSRTHNAAAVFLYREWLPQSGESLADFPIFFHYVNVGPEVSEPEMITDVYLPLKGS